MKIETLRKKSNHFPARLNVSFCRLEALEEYTAMMAQSSVGGLKDEIRSILRLPALTRGVDDLSAIRRNIATLAKEGWTCCKHLQEIGCSKRNELQKIQSDIEQFHQRIRKVDTTLEDITNKLQQNAELRIHIDKAKTCRYESMKKVFSETDSRRFGRGIKRGVESPPLKKTEPMHERSNS